MLTLRASCAIFVALLGGGMSACLLAVSTDGLAGSGVDASRVEAGPPGDGAPDAARPTQDGGDEKTFPAGASIWSGNGHAYAIYIEPNGVSWAAARTNAEQAGGHLATIGSADENAFVESVMTLRLGDALAGDGAGFWLGAWQPNPGGASEPGGGWEWIDGTPWSFTAWQVNQPDNTESVEHYLDIYRPGGGPLLWNDDALNGNASPLISYVVEFE